MANPYFVSGGEILKLEVRECSEYVIVRLDGEEVLKADAKNTPANIVLTRGLKRSDKTTVHHLEVQLWNKKAGYSLDARVYSSGGENDEQPIKTFKAKEAPKPVEELSIDDFYLQLHQPTTAVIGHIRTDNFYFQFD